VSIACPAACHPRRAPTATSPSVRCSTPQTAHSAAPLARSTAAGTPQVAPTLGALAGCVKSKHQALVGEAVTRAASRDTVDSVDAVLSGRLTQASLSAVRPRAAQTCVPHKGLGAQQTSPLLGFICSREAKQTGRVTTSDTADAETRSPGKHERKHPPSPSLVQQCASSKVPGTQLETGELGHGRQRPAKAAAHAQSVQRAACLESPERPRAARAPVLSAAVTRTVLPAALCSSYANWLRCRLQVKPGVSLSAEEAVRAQLDALAANDEPWHAMLDCKMCRALRTAAADARLPLAGPTTA